MPYKTPTRRINLSQLRQWSAADIKALRSYAGFSQSEMADKLGTTKHAISDWERAKKSPVGTSLSMLTLLANHIGFFESQVDTGGLTYRYPSFTDSALRVADRS